MRGFQTDGDRYLIVILFWKLQVLLIPQMPSIQHMQSLAGYSRLLFEISGSFCIFLLMLHDIFFLNLLAEVLFSPPTDYGGSVVHWLPQRYLLSSAFLEGFQVRLCRICSHCCILRYVGQWGWVWGFWTFPVLARSWHNIGPLLILFWTIPSLKRGSVWLRYLTGWYWLHWSSQTTFRIRSCLVVAIMESKKPVGVRSFTALKSHVIVLREAHGSNFLSAGEWGKILPTSQILCSQLSVRLVTRT